MKMETKEIKIDIPEGYEIDKENSTFECVRLKKIEEEFEYVDLGLPSGTLWATCNVGAKKPEEYGKHLNWEDAPKYNCPSIEQINELKENCNWVWCKINNVNGYIVIGKNGNNIFLPAAGILWYDSHINKDLNGIYWSHSIYSSESDTAYYLSFYSDDIGSGYGTKYFGKSVRQVKNK